MKLRKKQNRKTITLILLSVLVAGTAVAFFFWKSSQDTESSTVNSSSDSKSQRMKSNTSNEKEKESPSSTSKGSDAAAKTDNSTTHEKEKEITPAYEGSSADASPSLTGAITHTSVANNNLIIRTTINQSGLSGTCNLTLQNGSVTVTRSSAIALNPSSTTCEGFDIPVSELGKGDWNISIVINAENRTTTLTGVAKI